MNKYLRIIFYGSKLFTGPLEALFTLLIFIITKELNADPLQLTFLACAKPVVALFAYFLSSFLAGRAHRIKNYLLLLTIAGAILCLLFPYVDNVWFYVGAYAVYMTTLRSVYPAWIELLKRHFEPHQLGKVAANGSCLTICNTIFASLVFSSWMDADPSLWKWLFVALGWVQLGSTLLLLLLPKTTSEKRTSPPASWKQSWDILKSDSRFRHYLWLSFIGGLGIVIIMPVIPIYFEETLHLSYKQLAIAISLCRGVAFLVSSYGWVMLAKQRTIYSLLSMVNIISALFIGFLLTANVHTGFLYVAYLMYGAMQSGCELCWNISGPLFSKEKESTSYSSLNLAMIGIRGCIIPFVGQWLFLASGATGVFVFAGSLFVVCFFLTLRADHTQDLKTGARPA